MAVQGTMNIRWSSKVDSCMIGRPTCIAFTWFKSPSLDKHWNTSISQPLVHVENTCLCWETLVWTKIKLGCGVQEGTPSIETVLLRVFKFLQVRTLTFDRFLWQNMNAFCQWLAKRLKLAVNGGRSFLM